MLAYIILGTILALAFLVVAWAIIDLRRGYMNIIEYLGEE